MTFLRSREAVLTGALLVLLALIATRFPGFIAPANLAAVFNDTAPLIILALGQMVVILTRCIDLSVAANLALCGMVAALLNVAFPGLPVVVIVAAVTALGAALGAVNGLLVWKVGIPPIVVTLGTLTIFRGVIFLISDGAWVNAHQMTDPFKALPRSALLGLPVMSWCAIAVIVGTAVLVWRTALGRSFYAVGGNPHAAVYTGIDVGRTQFTAFVLSGALAGLTGYLWVARYAVAYVDIAAGFELDVIAACVIGGIGIAGGIGSVGGAVLGALFLGVIKNALPVVDISPFWQMAISGAAIITAVILNSRTRRAKGRLILRQTEGHA
ncbi:rhamnose ABC transporter membrane protein [Loktanella fryxellensis]|uniref:Rhamnose ABC transporter membrane protein n=1 Tax=Loktanella fryxellensis TaxID=245187 RepID=A0A1H8F169_9RHOB|nr:ABC transporter permease [Loktanella fryxellensis]SEN25503.1 rhamnose ABC transporter membrane protein [Loktanella fryxellensis]